MLKKDCVPIGDCNLYLSRVVKDIQSKNNWRKDYDKISESTDIERAYELLKFIQIQKFLLAVRDVEKLKNIPYEQSMTNNLNTV